MKITEVYVELGIKRVHDYQSCTNTIGLRGELGADDDPAARVNELQRQCYKLLLKKLFFPGAPAEAQPAQ